MTTAHITTLLLMSSVSCVWAGGGDIFFWMSDATTTLGFRVQQKLRNEPNLVIAPFGLHSVLSFTLQGARGATELELLTLLSWQTHIPSDLFYFYAKFFYEIDIVNAILAGRKIPIHPRFMTEAKNVFKTLVLSRDPKNPQAAEDEINEFMANRTSRIVQTIIPRGRITHKTSLVLASSLTFKGQWTLTFDPAKTQRQSFYKNDVTTIQVPIMRDTRVLLYKKDIILGLDMVQIPLLDTEYTLLLVIPNQGIGLSELEDLLSDPDIMDSLYSGMSPTMVELALPKFKIETKLDLKDTLRELGMVKASIPYVADFGGFEELVDGRSLIDRRGLRIISTSIPQEDIKHNQGRSGLGTFMNVCSENLYISNVYHSITLELNEFGLRADSIAEIEVQKSRNQTPVPNSDTTPPQARVVADRPFLFLVGRFYSYPWILMQGRFSG